MKLRRLELVNVRRFGGQRAVLGPFGDGLTTITAENESGKSTFLDALHALFFVAHGSSSQEVKSLQPHSGGAVGVAAEIEVDGKAFRVEKSFLVQKSAKVIDVATGQVIKQQGDAEAWIEDRINKSNKGPAGLLWVRQGATHVDPEGKDKDASNVATRRDLMSSVRGQIDAVTGGRRMDRIVAQCRKELDALATKSLRAKAGSPWKTIEDDVEALTARKAALAADVKALADALATKRRANLRLKALQDPHKDADRAAHITDAAKALEEARHHDQSVTQAEGALALLAGQTATLGRQIGEFEATRERRRLLAREVDLKEKDAALTRAARASSDAALAEAQRVIAGSQEARDTLAKELQAARKAERSREKWNRLCIVANQKGQVASPLKRRSDADLILGKSEIGQADLDGIADLGRRMSIAHEQRRTQFARFEIAPEGGAIATRDGASVAPEVSHLIDQDMVIALAGFGEITLSPAAGTGQGIEDPEAIGVQLRAALGALGVSTANEARAAFNARQSAMNDRAVAIAELRALTPDGVDVLDSEWRDLCAALGHAVADLHPVAAEPRASSRSAEDIEGQIATADVDLQHLRASLQALQDSAIVAASGVAEASGVLAHLMQEQAAIAKPADEDQKCAALQVSHQEAAQKEQVAAQALAQLKQNAPDLAIAQATYDRLISAQTADVDEINKLERELARVDGAIETQSEGAVEEKLLEVSQKLEKATERARRYALQAKALDLLITHLDAARRDAQDTYFEPIRNELQPLLAQLHNGADFELDPDKMLVSRIIRNGVPDEVTQLSGGAYEQIAILTRLAFAKLFAKQGRPIPLILDDALVHTDDERISTMFNMLSQAAQDQQIIVLSCRTRAFFDLGGTRAFIETEPV